MTDYVTCVKCREIRPVFAYGPSGAVCEDCVPDEVKRGLADELWNVREGLPSRMRATMLGTRLMDAFASADPGEATKIICEMHPADYRQVIGLLCLRAFAAEAAIEDLAPAGSRALRHSIVDKLSSQTDDVDIFAMFAD